MDNFLLTFETTKLDTFIVLKQAYDKSLIIFNKINKCMPYKMMHRYVTAGATGATVVAPKFSDTLTLFQPGGADSAPTSQRLHQKIPHGYISGST